MKATKIETISVEQNTIIIASFGTLSTGISLDSIHNIFLTESFKSDSIIRQSIGRGMRKLNGKKEVVIFDFVDDFAFRSLDGKKILDKNYLYKHMDERINTYKTEKFPYKIYNISLT